MAATKAQRDCIENTFGAPAAVVAGAGSGKTETLTNRVVYALQHPEASGVDDIDQILAITYTNKAAGELKSRIKAALEREATADNGLARQALKVDGAWISTIHGMFSRILKENAFTFGVDPSFRILSDEVRGQLLDSAIEEALLLPEEDDRDGLIERTADLFDEYRRSDVKDMLTCLIETAAGLGSRVRDAFVLQPQVDVADSLLGLVQCTQQLLARFEDQAASTGKPLSKTAQAYCETASAAVRETLGLAPDEEPSTAVVSNERLGQLKRLKPGDALRYAALFPKVNASLKPAKEALEGSGLMPQAALAGYASAISLSIGSAHLRTLVLLADKAHEAFGERKRALGCLDNDDLLSLVASSLGDPSNAAVARRYASQFRLVMVDEFQDTNQMQVDMINLVAGGEVGAPSEKLCVVGDAQQSIYRFRNADLAVFQEHVEAVRSTPNGKVISLGDNFRSHSEILAFSKGVFSSVFEDSYLDLLHGRDEARAASESPFFGLGGDSVASMKDEADDGAVMGGDSLSERSRREGGADVPHRVNVKVFGAKGSENISDRMAASIAHDLRTLCDRGNRPGQMAVLLGKMTHAEKYASALQAVGLKCAITGGTVFKDSPEARVVIDLCYALSDMHDTQSLIGVLTSDLFCLEAGDFLRLVDDGNGATRNLSSLFADCVNGADIPDDASPLLAAALSVLVRAARRVGLRPMSSILEDVLVESGWLHRLGQSGQARAGNAFKAIRMARDIERDSAVSALRLARQLEARVDTLKEAPGVLSAEGDDFVRIMTIHASKGLSIPIVAVAEAEFSQNDRSKLKIVSHGGATYVGLGADASLDSYDKNSLVRGATRTYQSKCGTLDTQVDALKALRCASSLADFYCAIRRLNELGDIEEHQRKLYVAYTRAKDALIVAMRKMGSDSSKREGAAIDVPRAIAAVLLDDDAAPEFAKADDEVRQLIQLHTAYPDSPGHDIDWTARLEVVPMLDEDGEGNDAGEDADEGEKREEAGPHVVLARASCDIADGLGVLQDVPYRAQRAEDLFSASSLKRDADSPNADGRSEELRHDDIGYEDDSIEASEAPVLLDLTFGEDDEPPASAADRGTAFHALCEWSARRWIPGEKLPVPPDDRVAAMARLYGMNARQERELPEMLRRWFASDQAHAVERHAHVVAEQPFWVKLADGEHSASPLVMQGFIDLLAYDEMGKGSAYVIDYKTGTLLDSDKKRRAAYGMQARCYAYALLSQGFDDVRLDFYFVDQPESPVTSFPAAGEPAYRSEELRAELLTLALRN